MSETHNFSLIMRYRTSIGKHAFERCIEFQICAQIEVLPKLNHQAISQSTHKNYFTSKIRYKQIPLSYRLGNKRTQQTDER